MKYLRSVFKGVKKVYDYFFKDDSYNPVKETIRLIEEAPASNRRISSAYSVNRDTIHFPEKEAPKRPIMERIESVKEIDIKASYRIWKENIKQYDELYSLLKN